MEQEKIYARQQIRDEIERLFANAPKTKAAWELQEELLANCMERYEDLTAEGMAPEEVIENVVASIGNVDELIADLPAEDGVVGFAWDAQRRRNSALIVTLSVGLYILALVVFSIGLYISVVSYQPAIFIGLIVAGFVCIVPTCMLIYNAYRWPKYERKQDTVVENFKQWNQSNEKLKAIRKAVDSLLWMLTVVVYLLVSFITHAWWITWIIFLISACLQSVVALVFKMKELD